MKKLSFIIICIVAMMIMSACNASDNNRQNTNNETATPTTQVSPEPTPEPSPTASPTPSPTMEPKEALIGEWKEMTNETIMRLAEDGKVYQDDVYIADYKILDNELVEYTRDGDTIFVNFEIEDDVLKWGTNFECLAMFRKVE